MIRIYCDKNIYSSIKTDKSNFIPELKELMDELKDKVIFTYSTAHHNDLANSDKSYWDEDLLLMEEYVEDNYFFYNPIKKVTECYIDAPINSFYEIDHETNHDFEQIIQNVFNDIEDPLGGFFKTLMNNLLNLELPFPTESVINEKDKKLYDKFSYIIPQKNKNTLKDYYQFGQTLLEDKEEVKKMKRLMEEFSNSDNYSYEKWQDEYDKKFSEFFNGKTFSGMLEEIYYSVEGYNDYDRFILFFTSLDIFNIAKDKPLRKTQAMSSIHIDADHAWYGSFSDYLITNDKGLAIKAHITYKYFKIQTKILMVKDFINIKEKLLIQEESTFQQLVENIISPKIRTTS